LHCSTLSFLSFSFAHAPDAFAAMPWLQRSPLFVSASLSAQLIVMQMPLLSAEMPSDSVPMQSFTHLNASGDRF